MRALLNHYFDLLQIFLTKSWCNRFYRFHTGTFFKDNFVIIPDAVAAFFQVRAVLTLRTYPDHFIAVSCLATIGIHAIPLVGSPSTCAICGIIVSIIVTVIPCLVPLHHKVVGRVYWITPDFSHRFDHLRHQHHPQKLVPYRCIRIRRIH